MLGGETALAVLPISLSHPSTSPFQSLVILLRFTITEWLSWEYIPWKRILKIAKFAVVSDD